MSEHFPTCRAEQHRGEIAYRCILSVGHDGPHGRLVPEPTWWTGDDTRPAPTIWRSSDLA